MPITQKEEALVFAAKNGNVKCFEELYKLYYDKIYALAVTVMKNRSDAEDILQTTFIKAWQNLNKLENNSAFNTWLQRITLNQCNSLLRKNKSLYSTDDEGENGELLQIESDLMLPEEYTEREDLSIRLKAIIYELSVVQRETILLYYYNNLSVEEIAHTMDCSEGTVKSRLFLARKAIRTEIEEQEKKTGEKFYGIAGATLIPFASLFIRQIKSTSISGAEAANVLNRVSHTLFNTPLNPTNAARLSDNTINTTKNVNGQPIQQPVNSPLSSTGVSSGASVNAASTAIKSTFPLWAKIVSIIAGIGLIAGGGFAAWNMLKPDRKDYNSKEPTNVVETTIGLYQEPSTEKPKIIYDIDPSELPNSLSEFLQVFDFGYSSSSMDREFDCEEIDNIPDYFTERIVGNPTMINLNSYPGGEVKKSFESHSDPLGRYPDGWGYIAVPKNKTLWIMQNVFNISQTDAVDMLNSKKNSNPDFYEYEDNGTTYYCNKIGGLGGPGFTVTFKTVRYDGEKYYFVYDCSDAVKFEGTRTVTYYAEMALKETDGLEYWSLYRHTENIPTLPEPTDKKEGDTSKNNGSNSNSDSATSKNNDDFSISDSEIEAEIDRIRTYYYSPSADDMQKVIEKGQRDWNYSRDYRYHNDKLVFAFVFDGTEEHRLYFKDDHMIRYIDENKITYDYPKTSKYSSWEEKVLNEAYSILKNTDDEQSNSAWLGTWTASSGESLEIKSVTKTGMSLIYNKYSEQGNMMNVNYEMEFDDDAKTIASEIGSPNDHGGWEYTFVLTNDYITVKSRYPDQIFYKAN